MSLPGITDRYLAEGKEVTFKNMIDLMGFLLTTFFLATRFAPGGNECVQ
jgi:hypothetical protein